MLKVKIEPIEDWVEIVVSGDLSPEARSKAVADFARERLAEALDVNRKAFGGDTPYSQYVDGRQGAALESVNPDNGRIVFEFELIQDALRWIYNELLIRSPVRRGVYRKSHRMFADGVEVDPGGPLPVAQEYSFANTAPYARKIEIGKTKSGRQFTLTVDNYRPYDIVSAAAARRFGNIAKIGYTFRGYVGGGVARGRAGNKAKLRYPTITVRPT